MAKKIVITLRKGGVGKTSLATNLSTALHKKGKHCSYGHINYYKERGYLWTHQAPIAKQ